MSWDQVRHDLDIPRLTALNNYWEYSPPTHVLVAQYFGIKKPVKVKAEDAAASLMDLINQGGI